MTFRKKKQIYGKRKRYSVINKLIEEEKINDSFLYLVNCLSLEELIAVKLEMSAKASGGSIFGIPVWNSLKDICRDASLKFALSAARTKAEAAVFLGISISTLREYMNKYSIKEYFEEKEND